MAAFYSVGDWIQAVSVVVALLAVRTHVGELRGGHFIGNYVEVIHFSKVWTYIYLYVQTRACLQGAFGIAPLSWCQPRGDLVFAALALVHFDDTVDDAVLVRVQKGHDLADDEHDCLGNDDKELDFVHIYIGTYIIMLGFGTR